MPEQRDFFTDELALMAVGYAYLVNTRTGKRGGKFRTVQHARQAARCGVMNGFSNSYAVYWQSSNGAKLYCGRISG